MKKIISSLFLVLATITSIPAFSEDNVCSADIEKYCDDVEGRPQIQECLQDHERKISCQCREHQKLVDEKIKKKDCKREAEKYCSTLEGKGDQIQCLSKHFDSLSCECRENVRVTTEILRKGSLACETDREEFCSKVQPGGGRIQTCLKDHKKELSEPCKDAMKQIKKYTK